MCRNRWLLASIVSFVACVSEPKRLPASMDPSNPDAPEAPPAPQLTAFAASTPEVPASDMSQGEMGHSHHGASSDGGVVVYTCPMHPEVQSSKPGSCPKCAMGLVPEKPGDTEVGDAGAPGAAPADHDHAPGHGGHP
ncbi:heavy metal-binding domain-containing protein [Myxococcus xanthus]|uniref:heavy metal-binding domain-containing protein n=2 Tax=Myxococcaceae TaxID=31 RepID=UPI0034D962BA